MTHQTNAQRLADELGQGHPLEDTVAEASLELRRLSAIEHARDVAVEMAAQYAAERDQLRDEVNEQARLNGMGAERELALMAERDALRAQLAAVGDTQSPSGGQDLFEQTMMERHGWEQKDFKRDDFGYLDGHSATAWMAWQACAQPATPKPVPMTDEQAVRGILCNRCNTVLGLCEDDDKLLSTLARYLRKCHG